MKKLSLLCMALMISALASAYGISPSRAERGGAVQNNPNQFQIPQPGMPQPQPSNGLVNPQQASASNAQTIQDNIKNYQPDDWAKAWEHVTVAQAKTLHADSSVLFADARSKAEYDQGHIPGAIP